MSVTPLPCKLSPSQERLFLTLADGQWHRRGRLLLAVSGRRSASLPAVAVHVSRLRSRIEPLGYRIEGNHNPNTGGWRMLPPEHRGAP